MSQAARGTDSTEHSILELGFPRGIAVLLEYGRYCDDFSVTQSEL